EGAREAVIRVFDAQCGRRNRRKVFGDDHGCGFGQPGGGGLCWIGDESDFSGAGLLDAVEAGDLGVRGTVVQACVEGGGDLCKFHGGWGDASKSYTNSKMVHPPCLPSYNGVPLPPPPSPSVYWNHRVGTKFLIRSFLQRT